MTDTERKHILYRWWDAEGRLLYVGKSISVLERLKKHRQKSAFFDEAAAMTIELFPDAESLGAGEVAAILAENPIYNIAVSEHRPDMPARRIQFSEPWNEADWLAGRWVVSTFDEIEIGDLVRATHPAGTRPDWQGMVDDDSYDDSDGEYGPDDEEGAGLGDELIIYTDTGAQVVLTRPEARLFIVQRWVTPDPNDPVVAEASRVASIALIAPELRGLIDAR